MIGKPLYINSIEWGGPDFPGSHYVDQVSKVHNSNVYMGTYRVTRIYRVELGAGFITIRVELYPVELSPEGGKDPRYSGAFVMTKTIVCPSIMVHYEVPPRGV